MKSLVVVAIALLVLALGVSAVPEPEAATGGPAKRTLNLKTQTQEAIYTPGAEDLKKREEQPRQDCRQITKMYLDRVVNGPEIERLNRNVREQKELVGEVAVSAAHPEGAASNNVRVESQIAYDKAQNERNDYERETYALAMNPLYWVCKQEAERNAMVERGETPNSGSFDRTGPKSGFGGPEVMIHITTQTFLGVYDSVYQLHGETLDAIIAQFSITIEKMMALIEKVLPSTQGEGKLKVGDVFWLLAGEFFPLVEVLALLAGLVLTVVLLYVVSGAAFPILTFYYFGYQYIWLVWFKCFLFNTAIRGTAQEHPDWKVDHVLYYLVMETDYGMQIFAATLSALFLIAAVGCFIFLPWFLAIFKFPRRLRILTADGRMAAEKV